MTDQREAILDAALIHVAFDGWSEATLRKAASDAEVPLAEARSAFPRGAVDLALAYHRRGDDRMATRIAELDQQGMRMRERIARAIRARIEVIEDKEAVRRGTTLFALPQHSADGARAIWGTADRIWIVLGDTSQNADWYTKRATLSGVYGSTVLYWLGDDSYEQQDTWGFIDRRIDDVMQIEKAKAAVQANPVFKAALAGPSWLANRIRAPNLKPRSDMPGSWRR